MQKIDEGASRRCSLDCVPFAPGDPVRLKSGGPLMTVLSIDSIGAVSCMWSNSNSGSYENEYATFPPDALVHDDN